MYFSFRTDRYFEFEEVKKCPPKLLGDQLNQYTEMRFMRLLVPASSQMLCSFPSVVHKVPLLAWRRARVRIAQ